MRPYLWYLDTPSCRLEAHTRFFRNGLFFAGSVANGIGWACAAGDDIVKFAAVELAAYARYVVHIHFSDEVVVFVLDDEIGRAHV